MELQPRRNGCEGQRKQGRCRRGTPAVADAQERTIVVENALYRVEFSNRGAVVKSWQLKKYKDDAKPQRTLDLVHADSAQMTGGWPFSLVLDDPQLEKAANTGLYKISPSDSSLSAPAEVDVHLERRPPGSRSRNFTSIIPMW